MTTLPDHDTDSESVDDLQRIARLRRSHATAEHFPKSADQVRESGGVYLGWWRDVPGVPGTLAGAGGGKIGRGGAPGRHRWGLIRCAMC